MDKVSEESIQLEENEQLNPQGCGHNTNAENDSTHEALLFLDEAASPFELPPSTQLPEESSTNVPPQVSPGIRESNETYCPIENPTSRYPQRMNKGILRKPNIQLITMCALIG